MKEYETLTREKVDVVPFGCGMPETHLMQDWSDRMLDLILNGPTINGIKKDEVRAMLRETYTALKQYEKIGPMASPFINDPTAIVARAFSELYPGVEYVAQYVPDLRDETNGTAYGLTIFPDDGSTPIVCISAEAPISAAPELLAHELAHARSSLVRPRFLAADHRHGDADEQRDGRERVWDQPRERRIGIIGGEHVVHDADHRVLVVVFEPALHHRSGAAWVLETPAGQAAHEC